MSPMPNLLSLPGASHPLALNRSSHFSGDDVGPGSHPNGLFSVDIAGTNCLGLSSPESTAWNKDLCEVVTLGEFTPGDRSN